MTVFIEWSTSHWMYQITIMWNTEESTFYIPESMLSQLRFIFKRLTIDRINLGSTITQEQGDSIKLALGKRG